MSVRSLRETELAAARGEREAGEIVRRAAVHAISRPASVDARARPLAPGETWLVGVQAERGEIWRLVADDRPARGRAPLVREALKAAELAAWLVGRDVPAFAPPQQRHVWEAIPVSPTETSSTLDGSSYGLALFLAAASHALGRAVPEDLVALGALGTSGGVTSVDGLSEKLTVLRGWAPGLRRLLVAPTQLDEARRRLPLVDVVAVSSVAEALDVAWPSVDETLAQRWSESPPDRDRMANVLFRAALHGESTFGWAAVVRATATLVRLAESDEARWQLEIAHAIARRHESNEGVLAWPTEEQLRELARPIRLTLLAHVVQAQADAGAEDVEHTLDRAAAHVAPRRERHAEDAKLLGALGRLAALYDLERAESYLEDALRTWREIDRLEDAAHPLCEALRVRSLRGGELGPLRALASEVSSAPTLSLRSRAFIRCALGSAAVLVGEHEHALSELDDRACAWDRVPPHLDARRLRWLARAHRERGDARLATSLRSRLVAIDPVSAQLAELDVRLREGADVERELEQLRSAPSAGAIVRRLERHPQKRGSLGEWLVDAYPY